MEVTQESGHEQGEPCDGWVLGSSPPIIHHVGVYTFAVCALKNVYQVPDTAVFCLERDSKAKDGEALVGSSNILTGGFILKSKIFLKRLKNRYSPRTRTLSYLVLFSAYHRARLAPTNSSQPVVCVFRSLREEPGQK